MDKPPKEAGPMSLEQFRFRVNNPPNKCPLEGFRKSETERLNLLLQIQEEQLSSQKSPSLLPKVGRCFVEWWTRLVG